MNRILFHTANNFGLRVPVFLILVLAALPGSAQTLTQSFNEPSVGDVDKTYSLDTSNFTSGMPTAITGSNVVWDFTKLKGAFPVNFDSILSPSAVPASSLFPGVSFVQKRNYIQIHCKSESSPPQTEIVGLSSGTFAITFTNSAVALKYPVGYGYAHTDPATGTFTYNNTVGVCNGQIKVTADGTGTLLLPGQVSFQNVLRVRSVEQLTLSSGFLPVGTVSQVIYAYYVPGKKYALLTTHYQNYQLLVGTPTITAQAFGNFDFFTVEGLRDFDAREGVEIYPNPCGDLLYVRTKAGLEVRSLTLRDVQGREVIRKSNSDALMLSGIGPGIYVVEIRTTAGSVFKRVVRE